MKGLNLSGWKKIAEDKKTTTLKHDKGHVMTLAHSSLPKIQHEALKRLKFDDGGKVQKFAEKGNVEADDSSDDSTKPVTVNVNAAPATTPMQAGPAPQVAAPVVPNVPNMPSAVLPSGAMSAPGVAQNAQGAIDLNQKVQAAQSAAEVPTLQGNLGAQGALNQRDADNVNMLNQAHKNMVDFTSKNPINEKAYLDNMGAGRKMATALGLIMGGAGAGVTGGPNMAYDFLNKQIDRNIQGQKDRYGQQQTVWGAYKDLYGSNQIADNMARAHNLEMMNTQGQLIAKQLGTPTAAAAAMDLKAKTGPAINKAIMDSAGGFGSIPMNVPAKGASQEPSGMPNQGKANPHQNLIDQGLISGTPSANASIPQEKQQSDYAEDHILVPNSEQHFKNLAYTPKAKEDLAAIQTQYNQAIQADKGLSDLHGKFADLIKETNGISGRIHRGLNPHAIGALGAGIGAMAAGIPSLGIGIPAGAAMGGAGGEAFGHGVQSITNTAANRSYDSDKTALLGYVSSALKGTNIGSGQIQEIVDNNSPESGDTPALLAKKEKNIKEFIKNHTDTSLIKTWGLTNR